MIGITDKEEVMELSIQTIRDALWWVKDGLDNADLDRIELERTQRCHAVAIIRRE